MYTYKCSYFFGLDPKGLLAAIIRHKITINTLAIVASQSNRAVLGRPKHQET